MFEVDPEGKCRSVADNEPVQPSDAHRKVTQTVVERFRKSHPLAKFVAYTAVWAILMVALYQVFPEFWKRRAAPAPIKIEDIDLHKINEISRSVEREMRKSALNQLRALDVSTQAPAKSAMIVLDAYQALTPVQRNNSSMADLASCRKPLESILLSEADSETLRMANELYWASMTDLMTSALVAPNGYGIDGTRVQWPPKSPEETRNLLRLKRVPKQTAPAVDSKRRTRQKPVINE